MAIMWNPSSVASVKKDVADAGGMVVSEDGQMAQVEVRAALTQRLQLIPLEQLEAQLTIVGDLLIQFQGVATTPFFKYFSYTHLIHSNTELCLL
jgi:hypothetical protein